MLKLEDEFIASEAGSTILKLLLAVTPGGSIIDEFIQFRSKVKQARLNSFLSRFHEYFTGNKIEINPNLNVEDFDDLFESVIKKVIQTKSKEKHDRFRDILLNCIDNEDINFENAGVFLDLVSDLSEPAVLILKHYKNANESLIDKCTRLHKLERELPEINGKLVEEMKLREKGYANNLDAVNAQRIDTDLEIKKLRVEIKALNSVNMASTYELEEDNFLYLKQILLSKGLLKDNFTGAVVGGSSPFTSMTITEFGMKFIDFLKRG